MTISKDLLLAILAMDSYNRGYNAGIEDPSAVGGGLGISNTTNTYRVGAATIVNEANDADGVYQAAGFYAISYNVDASGLSDVSEDFKTISYRGTDDLLDVSKGWVTGAGIWQGAQAKIELS